MHMSPSKIPACGQMVSLYIYISAKLGKTGKCPVCLKTLCWKTWNVNTNSCLFILHRYYIQLICQKFLEEKELQVLFCSASTTSAIWLTFRENVFFFHSRMEVLSIFQSTNKQDGFFFYNFLSYILQLTKSYSYIITLRTTYNTNRYTYQCNKIKGCNC